jgi:hypothetical protein
MNDETRLVPAEVTSALAAEATIPFAPVTVAELTTKMNAAIDLIAALIPDSSQAPPVNSPRFWRCIL